MLLYVWTVSVLQAALSSWLASFDQAAPDEADDEAALHQEG